MKASDLQKQKQSNSGRPSQPFFDPKSAGTFSSKNRFDTIPFFQRSNPAIQAKLTVNAASDLFNQDANQVKIHVTEQHNLAVQRQPSENEDSEHEDSIHDAANAQPEDVLDLDEPAANEPVNEPVNEPANELDRQLFGDSILNIVGDDWAFQRLEKIMELISGKTRDEAEEMRTYSNWAKHQLPTRTTKRLGKAIGSAAASASALFEENSPEHAVIASPYQGDITYGSVVSLADSIRKNGQHAKSSSLIRSSQEHNTDVARSFYARDPETLLAVMEIFGLKRGAVLLFMDIRELEIELDIKLSGTSYRHAKSLRNHVGKQSAKLVVKVGAAVIGGM